MIKIKGFTLVNAEKFDRALNGMPLSNSERKGGVGNGAYLDGDVWKRNDIELTTEEVSSLEFALLAEYDKWAGFIKKGNDKVKTGSFWNILAKKPWSEPKVVFTYRFGNKVVDVPEGVELPGEIKAQRILKESAEAEKKAKKVKKVKREEE